MYSPGCKRRAGLVINTPPPSLSLILCFFLSAIEKKLLLNAFAENCWFFGAGLKGHPIASGKLLLKTESRHDTEVVIVFSSLL